MADSKISALTAVVTPAGTDEFAVNQGGVSKKVARSQLLATPALTLGTANAAGSAATAVRTDATVLAFDVTVPVTQAFSDAAAVGSASVAARRDHRHGMPANPTPAFATPSIVLGTAAAGGAAGTVIRSDATILAFDVTVPVTQAFSDAAAVGSASVAARRDHKHGMPANPTPAFATPSIALGTAAAGGAAGTVIRSDATILAFDVTVPVTQASADAAATGAATVAARRDHRHGMPTLFTGATPALTLGTSNVAGSATTVVRTDATILAFDATVPVTQAFSDAAATGSAAVAARRDHKHGMPAAPSPVVAIALATSSLTLNSTYTDITGATITASPSSTETWVVTGTFSFLTGDPGSTTVFRHFGQMLYDGAAQTGEVRYEISVGGSDGSFISTETMTWIITGVTAASHTVKLQAKETVGGGSSSSALLDNTRISLMRLA